MGKNKPLLWTAILTAASTGSALAQITGTPTAGDYYFKNVESGKFLGGANSWGTQASLIDHGIVFNVALKDGKYTLDSNTSNGGNNHYFTGTYVDGAAANVEIIETSAGQYVMKIGDKYIKTDGKIVTNDGDEASAAKWQIIPIADLKKAFDTATFENPADATFLIKGANFSRNHLENSAWKGFQSGQPRIGGPDSNCCAEGWNTNFDVYQEISDVPKGLYKLTVQGFYRAGGFAVAASAHNGGTEALNAILYANDNTITLNSVFKDAATAADADKGLGTSTAAGYIPNSMDEASKAFSAGLYKNEPVYVYVGDDGKLKIGIKKSTLISDDWTIFDNFELAYVGNVDIDGIREELQVKLAELITQAENYTDDKTLKDLATKASRLMGKVNKLTTDNPDAYVECANYASGVSGNLGEQIDGIGEEIAAAEEAYQAKITANQTAFENAQAAYESLLDEKLAELAIVRNAALAEAETEEEKDAFNELYDTQANLLETFKSSYTEAYDKKECQITWTDSNIEAKKAEIEASIEDAKKAFTEGGNAIAFAIVKSEIQNAKAIYTDEMAKLNALLTATWDGDVYMDLFLEASKKLNKEKAEIEKVEANNVEETAAKTKAANLAALAAIVGTPDGSIYKVYNEYETLATTLRDNYARAWDDIWSLMYASTETDDKGIEDIKDLIKNKTDIKAYYQEKVNEIDGWIEALEQKIEEANKNHEIKDGTNEEFCEGYNEAKAEIQNKLAELVSEVQSSLDELKAYNEAKTEIADLTKLLGNAKDAVSKMTDGDYTPDYFAATADGIQTEIDALSDAAEAAYDKTGAPGSSAREFKSGMEDDQQLTDEEGNESTLKGTTSITDDIVAYSNDAQSAFDTYKDIAGKIATYTDQLNGTPAVGEEGKEGYQAATPGLKGTAVNTKVTIDGTWDGTTYAEAIEEIEAEIAALQTELDEALKLTDAEHLEALLAINSAIATDIVALTNNYSANETAYKAAQMAQARLLLEAEVGNRYPNSEIEDLLDNTVYDSAEYGKAAADLMATLSGTPAEGTSIKADYEAIATKIASVEAASDDAAAIALLSEVVDALDALDARLAQLEVDAEVAKVAYAAETAAYNSVVEKVAAANDALNNAETGVAATLAPSTKNNRFAAEIAGVQTKLDAIYKAVEGSDPTGTLATDYANEVIVKDKKLDDKTNDKGEVTEKGYNSQLADINKEIADLMVLAKNESANQKAYDDFETLKSVKDIQTAIENARTALGEIEGIDVNGDGYKYYNTQLNNYEDWFTNLKDWQNDAYNAVLESGYTDPEENMFAYYQEMAAELENLTERIAVVVPNATANEEAHNQQLDNHKNQLAAWTDLFAEVTAADVSSAHESAINKLNEAKNNLDAYKRLVDREYKNGNSVNVSDMYLTAAKDQILSLQNSWDDEYAQAVADDNLATMTDFRNAYTNLRLSYNTNVPLVDKLSKLPYADDHDAITGGEDGIYSYATKIKNLRDEAEADFEEVQSAAEPTVFDVDKTWQAKAEQMQTEFEALVNGYVDDINTDAKNAAAEAIGDAQRDIDDARSAIEFVAQDIMGIFYNSNVIADVLTDAQEDVDYAAADATQEARDFAYTYYNTIRPTLEEGLEEKLADAKEKGVTAAWNAAIAAAEALAAAETPDIDGVFLDSNGETGGFTDNYDQLKESIEAAKEVWDDIEEGAKFDEYSNAKEVLDNYISTVSTYYRDTDGNLNSYLADVDDVKELHTSTYYFAYTLDQQYKNNQANLAEIARLISAVQEKLDAAKALAGALLVEHDNEVELRFNNVQYQLDNTRRWSIRYGKLWVQNRCAGHEQTINQIILLAFGKEKDALADQIELLKSDYDNATAAQDTEKPMDDLAAVKSAIESYSTENDAIYEHYNPGNPVLDEGGLQVVDEAGNAVYDKATAEETVEAYLALEKKIGQTKTQLSEMFEGGKTAIADATANVQQALDGITATYTEAMGLMESDETHQQVVDKYIADVTALGAAIQDAQAEFEQETADNTVLFYAENNLKTIEAIAQKYASLVNNIMNDEQKFDENDASRDNLIAKLDGLTAKLATVYSGSNYDNQPESEDAFSFTDKNGEEQVFDNFREFLNAKITNDIAQSKEAVQETWSANDNGGVEYYDDNTGSIEGNIGRMERYLAHYNAEAVLNGIVISSPSGYYADDDSEDLQNRYTELSKALNNLKSYNSSTYAQNSESAQIFRDIDGVVNCDENNRLVYTTVQYKNGENGEYWAIMAKAEELAEKAEAYTADTESKSYTVGDVDRNGRVNVADYSEIRNIAIGKVEAEPGTAKFYAANVNHDEVVDVADVQAVAYYIMNNKWQENCGAKARLAEPNTDAISIAATGTGTKQQIVIALDNTKSYVAAQMDIVLPEGVKVVGESLTSRANGHELLSNDLKNGAHRVLISTLENNEFQNTEEALLVLDVEVSASYNGGEIAAQNIVFVDATGRACRLGGVVTSGEATGIASLTATEKVKSAIYSVGGQLMNTLKKGINIIRNQDGTTEKVLVK